jgi:hypothetical protein
MPYQGDDGSIGYRCPAEPVRAYSETKGGRVQNTDGRKCLCNALLATAGLAQQRADGYVEPPLVTAGDDFTTVAELLHRLPAGQNLHTAADVVHHLQADPCATR